MATSSAMITAFLLLLLLPALISSVNLFRAPQWDPSIRLPSQGAEIEEEETETAAAAADGEVGTRWAVLVAGSNGYGNYRHQADVCHAYQLLRKGGLKEENIIVFMYDDVADNPLNPRPGVIINHPNGQDVYKGVPKDYTGAQVTAKNLYAVLLGNKAAVVGGSGKVIDSKPNDHIFIYYSDHGGPGVLGMPNMPYVYANEFIHVLKQKHASNSYKEMVIYVEACESGSIFEGMMPEDLNIYVNTASNAEESSWGTYCPGMEPAPPTEYTTCLGDLYSIAWMEDSETHNLRKETISRQYEKVKERTSNLNTYNAGSHVMEYGTKGIKGEKLSLYQGFDPSNANVTDNTIGRTKPVMAVNQRDADLLFMWHRYQQLDEKSKEKTQILKEMTEKMMHRAHLDSSIDFIGKLIFGAENGPSIIATSRAPGHPLVDDWNCLKSMVRVFESHCGSLTQYGMKHMRTFANICNRGIPLNTMEDACISACGSYSSAKWSPLIHGYSA